MSLLKLLVISLIMIIFSGCAEKKPIEIREFYSENIEDFIKKMQSYDFVEASLSIQYETKNSVLNGEAFLRISKNQLLLRVYYMGFPTGEIYQEDEEISSNLPIEKERLKELAIGIRRGFIWWSGNFRIIEDSENFFLNDTERILILKKDSFVPLKQTLNVNNQTILIIYDEHKRFQTDDGVMLTMPSSISVYYKNRVLKIKIDRIKIKNA